MIQPVEVVGSPRFSCTPKFSTVAAMTIVVLLGLAHSSYAQLLEVKPDRRAIIKESPSGDARNWASPCWPVLESK